MNNDIETEVLAAAEALPEYQTPGRAAVEEAKSLEDSVKRDALDVQADKAWRDSGLDLPYNHRAAFAEGLTNFADQPLPNKHIASDAMQVAGFDLATGQKRRTVLEDKKGLAASGVKDLKDSVRLVKTGKPVEMPPVDAAALAKIAATYLREGKSVDDFMSGVAPWSQAHLKTAWNAAVYAENMRILAYSLAGDRSVIPGPVPDQEMPALHADPKYAQAARRIYQSYKGEKFDGTEMEVAKWLTGHVRDFTLNPTMAAVIWARSIGGSRELKDAYLYGLEQYERTNVDWSLFNVAENISRVVMDPSNFVGMGIGKAVFTTAGRVAFKEFLKRGAVGAGVGGAVGATKELQTAGITGTEPTASGAAVGAVSGALFAGTLNAALPLLAVAGGALVRKGLKNLAEAPFVPSGSRRAQFGHIGERSFDPKTGVGSNVIWEFEKTPELKINLGQALAKVRGSGVTKEIQQELEPAIEQAYKSKKSLTGRELAGIVDEAFDPPRIQWVTPGAPPKVYGTTRVKDVLKANPEYADAQAAVDSLKKQRKGLTGLEQIQATRGITAARTRLREIEADLVSSEERVKGLMFAPGYFSNYPMGTRLEILLKDDPDYAKLKVNLEAERAKPMHWNRQENIGSINAAMYSFKHNKFSVEETAAQRAWAPGQPRNVPSTPMGLTLKERFSGSWTHNWLQGQLSTVSEKIEQTRFVLDGLTGDELKVAERELLKNGQWKRQVEGTIEEFYRARVSPAEFNERRMYSVDQNQSRLKFASNIAHLQQLGTPESWGLNPKSQFQWLELGDPASRRLGYETHSGKEKGTIGWASVTVHEMDEGGEALVAHELQSDWKKNLNEARREWYNEVRRPGDDRSYEQVRWERYREFTEGMPKDWLDTTYAQRQDMIESGFFEREKQFDILESREGYALSIGKVSNQPPMKYEDTFALNLMKATTYRAAQMGKDAVAFPAQGHIAARWTSDGPPVRAEELRINHSGDVIPLALRSEESSGLERMRKYFFRKGNENGRKMIADVLDDNGEKEAAQALRTWNEGDGPLILSLRKRVELVPMGFADYRTNMQAYEKWLKKEFGLIVENITGKNGLQPVRVPLLDGTKFEEQHFKGPRLTPEKREEILKKGIHFSKMESHYAIA